MSSLSQILSRLDINGATSIGGSSFSNYLVSTDNTGHIDPSLVTSGVTVSQVTTGGGGLSSISNPKQGDIAILDSNISYVRSSTNWLIISYPSSTTLPYTGSILTSNNVKDALDEIATRSVLIDTARTITAPIAFNTGSQPPFTTNSSAVVPNLTSSNLYVDSIVGPQPASYFRNASNINAGTLDPARLSSVNTYNITASRSVSSVSAGTAIHSDSTASLDSGVIVAHAVLADTATLSTTATNATNLNDGTGTYRSGAYYKDASNLTTGILLAGRINDTSHGSLGNGSLHGVAVGGGSPVAGFMSGADKVKLDTIDSYANANIPSFNTVIASGVHVNASTNPILTLASGGSNVTLTTDTGTNTVTIAMNTSGISHHGLGDLNNSSHDDHPQYINVGYTTSDSGRTIKAIHTFSTAGAPFNIAGTSQNVLVPYLNAQLLNGHASSYYTDIGNIVSTGTIPAWLGGSGGVIQSALYTGIKTKLLPSTGILTWTADDTGQTLTPNLNSAISATPSTIALRDSSGGITAATLTCAILALSGNAGIGGTLSVTGKVSTSATVLDADPGGTLVTKDYLAAHYVHI